MDDNIIFQPDKPTQEQKVPQTTEPVPVSSVEQPIHKQASPMQVVLSPQPISSVPPPPSLANTVDDSSDSFFSFVLSSLSVEHIIKFIAGGIIALLIITVVTKVVIPSMSRPKNEKVTLTYWGLWEDKNVMQSIISGFEKENPNITVTYSKQDIKQYRDRLVTRIQNGTGPDIFRFHNTWVVMLSSILLPLSSDTISSNEFQKSYYKVIQNDLIRNGAIYGIPLEVDTLSLFINTEIFKAAGMEVPKTWDDFLNKARMLTVKDENGKIQTSGAAMGTFDNITHAPDIISLLFVQNGANFSSLSSTSRNATDALSFYTSLAQGDGKVWDDTLDPSILAFSKGNLAMYFGYSWDAFAIKTANPNLAFAIYSVPHLPERNMTIASYWVEGVSLKSTHQKEALLFMKYLAKKETEQKFFSEISKTRLFGEPYARVDLAESLTNNQFVYPFVHQAQYAVSTPFSSETFDNGLNTHANNYLGDAIRSILNNTSPQTAIETLSLGIDQVLKQYGQL